MVGWCERYEPQRQGWEEKPEKPKAISILDPDGPTHANKTTGRESDKLDLKLLDKAKKAG
jgi:hypothetical protein